ncbi:MAG: inositol monophosphatase family protein [Acidobacteriota bacterium]
MSDPLLPLALAAAQLGGEILRSFFGRLKAGEIEEKTQNDFVTAADHASEAAITTLLRKHTPAIGILAEESGASGATGARWILDPLDGTLNFVRGFPHFAISLALEREGLIELGVIYDPMRDELYSATRGSGAWLAGRRLSVSGRAGLAGAFVTTGFPFRLQRHFEAYLRVFREVFLHSGAIRRPGAAALDLAHTAAGIFDAFFEFSLQPWDIAAGALLVREAGGVVSDLAGTPELFTRGNIVAGAPGAHRELLDIVRRHCREDEITP